MEDKLIREALEFVLLKPEEYLNREVDKTLSGGERKRIELASVFAMRTNEFGKVTHEAAIGRVDNKQVQTLMARGLEEERAIDLIVGGMLK